MISWAVVGLKVEGNVHTHSVDFMSLLVGRMFLEGMVDRSRAPLTAILSLSRPYLAHIINLTVANITPEFVSVCNNATWAIGELSVRIGSDMEQVIPGILPPLIQLINRQALNKSLLENAAIAVG